MAKTVFDISNRGAIKEYMHSTGVTEAVDGVEFTHALSRKGTGEILFTESIDTMPCKRLTPLINKEALAIKWFRGSAVSCKIEAQQISGPWPYFYKAVTFFFAQQGKGFPLYIKVIYF